MALRQQTRKLSRAEKQQETFEALISAAIEVVGEEGYAAASVTKITALANVANGTFYNYFESRQDLFDRLLPLLGERLLAHLRSHVGKTATGVERERERLQAYLEFVRITPGFIRIFHEAEVYSPVAYQQHSERYFRGYASSLRKSIERNEIRNFSEKDMDIIAFMLMAMQDYIGGMMRNHVHDVSEREVIDVYIKLISCGGLFSPPNGMGETA